MRPLSKLALALLAGLLCACQPASAPPPNFYFGADLSYVNEMEDCGATYLEAGQPQDPFELFAAHGTNLVRVRLWHNATWTNYSNLADVEKTLTRAKDAGMFTLLDFHYSDTWADPGAQEIPAAWENITDTTELADALYQYTYDTLIDLESKGLMPDFVQIGNETNPGLLKAAGSRQDWARDAQLFNAGIAAVRAAGAATEASPRVMLHVAQPENTGWWFREATAAGITDFDVIGISYYPQWSSFSISGLGSQVNNLRATYGKDVMVVEAGYPWTFEAADETASNVLTHGEEGYEISPAGQLAYMHDLTQTLISNGASGLVYWEPAWVSTGCSTRWGQGSHWENAAFFDFQNSNEILPVMSYPAAHFVFPPAVADGVVQEGYSVLAEDAAGDSLNALSQFDLLSLQALPTEDSLSLALTISGDALAFSGSVYRIYVDTLANSGADVDPGQRPISVAQSNQPEFIVEIQIAEAAGTVVPQATIFSWTGSAWQERTFTGSIAASVGEPSVIELSLPLDLLASPSSVSLGVISASRVTSRTASDLLGADATPSDAETAVQLSSFAHLELASGE